MRLSEKTITKLQELINEETEYRSGRQLVAFFNKLGENDVYDIDIGFPARRTYTLSKLESFNDTPKLEECIKLLFDPVNFIENYAKLDDLITKFNLYLAYDGWQVVRNERCITIKKCLEDESAGGMFGCTIEGKQYCEEIDISSLPIKEELIPYINSRIKEIDECMRVQAPLATIFLIGSTLEGILLGIAEKNPRLFSGAKSSAKTADGKVKNFKEWNLGNLIDTACEVGFLKIDVSRYSHDLRNFRNYIHPNQQRLENFSPDRNTVSISIEVLKAVVSQINDSFKEMKKD